MTTYVSDDRLVFVRVWDNRDTNGLGSIMTVATREDPDSVWGPPVRVSEEHS